MDGDVRLAGMEDIAAMKLAAITGRGTKKDFIDLFFLLKHYSLEQLIGFYEQKFDDCSTFLVMRSLTYFDDADQDVMPNMLETLDWETVKSVILREVKEFSSKG